MADLDGPSPRPTPDNLTQHVHGTFQRAVNRCINSFSPELRTEIRRFNSARGILEHMRGLEQNVGLGIPRNIEAFCNAVSRLSDVLDPYSACITSFMQVKPEICGLLCKNYTSFLNKLTDMLETITQDLELDRMIVLTAIDKAKAVGQSKKASDEPPWRLIDAMTVLHCDLLELFCKVCELFPTKTREGHWRSALRMAKVFWVPFDEHFMHFRQKVSAHRQVLVTELKLLNDRTDITSYESFRKFHEETFEQFKYIQSELKCTRIDRLKQWVAAESWTTPFEEVKRKRFPHTSTWILQHPQYKWWISPSGGSQGSSGPVEAPGGPRILSIQAKPGYGKSVLCGVVIQEHQEMITRQRSSQDVCTAMAYYFFDKQRPNQNDCVSALRAIVTQLLYQHQDKSELIDLAVLLKDSTGTGEPNASLVELKSLLILIMQYIQDSSLIFDGLDECQDLDSFLGDLEEISKSSTIKIFFASRPSVDVEKRFQSSVRNILLAEQSNFQDIEAYLEPEINNLVQTGLLELDDSVQNVVQSIAKKSRSMFLWANLLIQYLNSEMVTPQERLDALNDMSLFPELDALYTRILEKLYTWYSHKSIRRKIQMIFDWTCVAARALSVSELQIALGIQIGRATRKSNQIAGLRDRLIRMTGALIEVSQDGNVRFIHTSVLEFFMDAMDDANDGQNFRIDAGRVHGAFAATCLSYIAFDVPKQRLVPAGAQSVSLPTITTRHPLLLYSTQFWAYHACMSLRERGAGSSIADPLSQMLAAFLSDRHAVTVWTEAAWLFGEEPCVNELANVSRQLSSDKYPSLEKDTLQFCKDLGNINAKFAHVLHDDPGEIWEPSIPAFCQSRFWVETQDSRVIDLNSPDAETLFRNSGGGEPILVASQCCSKGQHIGIITLWPSAAFEREMTPREPQVDRLLFMADELASGWQMSYEVKVLKSQSTIHKLSLELPSLQMSRLLEKAFRSEDPKAFAFPVAFSPNIRQITVLNCLITIVPTTTNDQLESYLAPEFHLQELDIPRPVEPQFCTSSDHHLTSLYSVYCPCTFDWYHIMFSPSSAYVMVLRGPDKFAPYVLWVSREFIIYKDMSDGHRQPDFRAVSRIRSRVFQGPDVFKFHPREPVLVISQMSVTVLWFFEDPTKSSPITIHQTPLYGLAFSQCGNYVHGETQSRGLIIVNISKNIQKYRTRASSWSSCATASSLSKYSQTVDVEQGKGKLTEVGNYEKAPETLDSGNISFYKQGERLQISAIRQLNGTGEVLRREISSDGNVADQCLTRIPMCSNVNQSYTTVLNSDEAENVSMVLNKSIQDTYSVGTTAQNNLRLPLLITRKTSSIPQHSRKRQSQIELPGRDSKRILN
ncbi:unnamed protein product [Fusarium graminearum]|uniref:NACHT domain-containing protein n=2 Tax=Gibberella zeae TaxID=5518 RepID=A0A4E9EFB1_GIBZA|nr:unnamed protein product [Fusarium graminearum]CAG2011273.1 unnamed protein product [Fusarium graminearum]